MATLRLNRSETYADRLPMICMACGQPAVTHLDRKFTWKPLWTRIFLFVPLYWPVLYYIIGLIVQKEMTVEAPVCERHRGYWSKRRLLFGLTLIFLILAWLGSCVLSAAFLGDRKNQFNIALSTIMLTGLGLLVVWCITFLVVHFLSVRAVEITDRSIAITRLSPAFVDAFHDQFEDEPEERPLPRPRRDEDDDWDD